MLGFLQGFAYGLFISCIAWFFIGMAQPHLAVPKEPPGRFQVVLRYWLGFPFLAFLLWLTSLWGGFGATLAGWLAGLFAIAVEIPLERRWRRWRMTRAQQRMEAARRTEVERKRAALEREEREAGVAVLDPAKPPVNADDVVLALSAAKQRLLAVHRPELATQADRLYTRYSHALELLESRFSPGELTLERSRGLVAEVCRGAADDLNTMASLAKGVLGLDAAFAHRRLERRDVPSVERQALQRRLDLIADTEQRLRELSARNEGALTALDDAAVAVARIETDRPQASRATSDALKDLRRFIEKAEHYGRKS